MSYQEREAKAVEAIKRAIPDSLKRDMLKQSKGLFAELYENNEAFPEHYMASAIDGVGTKLLLAEAMGVYDTVGIDLVAMSANDLATLGAVSPFLFMDYLACEKEIEEKRITGDIIRGIVKGLEQCDASDVLRNSIRVNFGKGETASVDEMVYGLKPGYGFDVAGSMIGFIKKSSLRTKVNVGDSIIALKSSGAHSNGYTELRLRLLKGDFEGREQFRKLYAGKHRLDDDIGGTTIGKALLEPTRIYTRDVAKAAKDFRVMGFNNTGYGLKNLNRINQNVEFYIDNPIEPQQIFKVMQQESKFTDEQMYTTFNMGMGFFIVAKKEDSEQIVQDVKGCEVVGEVREAKSTRTVLIKGGRKMAFEGY